MLVTLSGRAGAGKSTVARLLTTHGYTELAFADELKEYLIKEFGFERRVLYADTFSLRQRKENEVNPRAGMTARRALTYYGQVMKEKDPAIWARPIVAKARVLLRAGKKVVISDCRFLIERVYIDSIRETRAIHMLISRKEKMYEKLDGSASHSAGLASHSAGLASHSAGLASHSAGLASHSAGSASHSAGLASKHCSETEHIHMPFHKTIYNIGTIETLKRHVESCLDL